MVAVWEGTGRGTLNDVKGQPLMSLQMRHWIEAALTTLKPTSPKVLGFQ